MGYTNYWKFKNINCQKQYDLAVAEIVDFVKWGVSEKYAVNIEDDETFIEITGDPEDTVESFFLDKDLNQININELYWCKTGRNEYDGIVLASMFILKKYLHGAIELSSDGFNHKSINSNYEEYCDFEIKEGYLLFKKFQATLPNEFKSGGIIPLFK